MPHVIAVVQDLMFGSRIAQAGQQLNISVAQVRDLESLKARLASDQARLVVVDMEIPNQLAPEAIRIASESTPRPAIVAFYPHVNHEMGQAAEVAGADEVLPRSRFSTQLGDILQRFAGV